MLCGAGSWSTLGSDLTLLQAGLQHFRPSSETTDFSHIQTMGLDLGLAMYYEWIKKQLMVVCCYETC